MKFIIEGEIYDTEKAVKVASIPKKGNVVSGEETLYKTYKGNWFRVQSFPDQSSFAMYVRAMTPKDVERWLYQEVVMSDEIVERFAKYLKEA
jgi:hypothetical protein